MIKYSGSTIEDWFYSETPINKMYYNGRVTVKLLAKSQGQTIGGTVAAANITWTQ